MDSGISQPLKKYGGKKWFWLTLFIKQVLFIDKLASTKPMTLLTRRNFALVLFGGALLVYTISLVLPAYRSVTGNSGQSVTPGFFALLFGAVGHKSWYANPLLWVAWFNIGKGRGFIAFLLAFVSSVVALTFLLPEQTLIVGSMGIYPYDVRAGYYVWLCAIALTALSGLVLGTPPLADESPKVDASSVH